MSNHLHVRNYSNSQTFKHKHKHKHHTPELTHQPNTQDKHKQRWSQTRSCENLLVQVFAVAPHVLGGLPVLTFSLNRDGKPDMSVSVSVMNETLLAFKLT